MKIAFKSRRLFLRALVSMDGGDEGKEEEEWMKVWEKSCHSKCFNSKSAARALISVAISLRVLSVLSRARVLVSLIKFQLILRVRARDFFFFSLAFASYFFGLLTFWLRGHFGSIRRSSGSRLTFMACCDWWCEPRSRPCISFCERPGTSSWACPFSFAGAL